MINLYYEQDLQVNIIHYFPNGMDQLLSLEQF